MDEKDFELAARLEQLERELGLEKVRQQKRPKPHGFDGSCPECGTDIPKKRIEAGYYICVDCVTEAEHLRRLGIVR